MSALVADRVSARYEGGALVLDQVSVSVARGEVLAVLGVNGSGKSTLLRVLAGIARPSSGAVRVLGDDASALDRRELARRVAVIPQRERVPPGVTVDELVALGRSAHLGWFAPLSRRDRDAIDAALERCDLGALRRRAYDTLSGGEQKRCLVARALSQDTPVLLADEPVASLDLAHQIVVCELITARAAEHNAAAVMALHDLNLAARFCERALVLRPGAAPELIALRDVVTRGGLRTRFDVSAYVGECPDDQRPFMVPLRGR